jgi:polar amino acid transport system permease protein
MSTFTTVLEGLPTTLKLTAGALIGGAVGAVPLVLLRSSALWPIRVFTSILIDFIRGIPAIVWLFVIYFGLGAETIQLAPFTAGLIGLGVISAAYLAEILRGGINSVHGGQEEAARALGMSATVTLASVVGPQAIRAALPAASTYAIGLLKDSSIASTIGVTEMVFRANTYAQQNLKPLQAFAAAGVIYLVISVLAAMFTRALDHRLSARVATS